MKTKPARLAKIPVEIFQTIWCLVGGPANEPREKQDSE